MEPSLAVGLLWFVVIALIFFAQHHVCDAYFVPAINVFVERMRSSPSKCLQRWGEEAVAGATICALGCNGPELFTNLISLYTGSDAGIGVVVGSEIFNLLIIVGAAVMAAPSLPLQIDAVPFMRDCLFYALSIALLYWALRDRAIQWYESALLLAAAAVYVAAVYFTTDLVNCIPALRKCPAVGALPESPKNKGVMHGIEVDVEEVVHGRMADGRHAGKTAKWTVDALEDGIHAEQSPAPRRLEPKRSASIGFVFHDPDALLGPVLKYEDLKEVVLMEMGVIHLEFVAGLQHVTLRLRVADAPTRDLLLRNIEKYSLGRPWVHGYDATVRGAVAHLRHTWGSKHESLANKALVVPHFCIDVLLRSTLSAVDVKDVKREGRWALCFLGAMFWLAVFSFAMLEIAEAIHYNIPALPDSFLGITVCAVGTSFPNAVASVIMSQQNRPAAAIANALGSNVQNVFLAMALPWVIYGVQHGGAPIDQKVAGIQEGVFWMMGTLILVLAFVLLPPVWSISRSNGVILIAVYAAYLLLTSGETFGWWPPLAG